MKLFLSTFINKIDNKGRVSIPAPFRAVLGGNSLIIYPSFIHECIEACSIERMEKLNTSIEQMDPFSEERDAFSMALLGESMQLGWDNEGRVVIPEKLLFQMQVKEKAAFVGKGNTFEIWSTLLLEEYSLKAREIAQKSRGLLKVI